MPQKTSPHQIGIVGLPDSGKSTLLARLYARGQPGGQPRQTRDLALTFPGPAEMAPGEQSTLEQIQELWEWISSNFDKKKKTVVGSQLRFKVRGRGLSRPEDFTIADLPGEVFQAVCQETSSGPKKDTVAALQAKFREQLPKMASLVLIVDSRKRNDVETVNLLESMLAAVAYLDGRAAPVFTLVVFTKALTPQAPSQTEGNDSQPDSETLVKLAADLADLGKRFKNQGHKWFRLVACESLQDLVKRETGGCIRWELPDSKAPAEAKRPTWVLTPYEAVLEVPKLMISWRRHRRLHRAACAAGAIVLATAAWLAGSWWTDRTEFKHATKEPITSLTGLADYYLRDKWYHPVKRFGPQAVTIWNSYYFHKQTEQLWDEEFVETKLTALDQLSKQPRWRMVDPAEYAALRTRLEREKQQLLEQAKTAGVQTREAALANVADPKTVIMGFDPQAFARSSTARNQALKDQQAMIAQLGSEEGVADHFHFVLAESGTNLLKLEICVYQAKTNAPFEFRSIQDRHYRDVADLAGRITTIGRGAQPVLARNTLQEVQKLLQERPGLSNFLAPEMLSQELQSLDSRIQELQKRHENGFAGLEDLRTTAWSKIGPYCDRMQQEMLDLPERIWWRERSQQWALKWQTSDQQYKKLSSDYTQAAENPEKQMELAGAFIRDAEAHAPEHLKMAEDLSKDARRERDRIAEFDKHARERLAQLQAKSWDETIQHCAAAARDVKQTSFRAFWEDQAKEFRAKFQKSRDDWSDTLKKIELNNDTPVRQQELLKSFVENVADHAPEHRFEARTKLDQVDQIWKNIQAAWQAFCETFQKFKADVDNFPALRAKQDGYRTCLTQNGRQAIASHRENLQSMEAEITRYDTEAANRLAQAGESMSKVGTGSTASQRVETFAAAARDVSKLEHDTHHKPEARDFAGKWLSSIQSRADELASYSREDAAFQEGLDLWGRLEQFGPQLHGPSAGEKARDGRKTLLHNWAEEKWKQTHETADQKAQAGTYREAIQHLQKYQDTQGKILYDVHVEDANKQIEQIRTQWADSAKAAYARLGGLPISKREDYDAILKQIHQVRDDFKGVIEVPPVVEAEFTRQLRGLNDKLLVWHKDRIDAVIGRCADLDSASKVIDRWDRLDELLEKIASLSSEARLKETHRAELQGAIRASARLEVLRQPIDVTVVLSQIGLKVEDNDPYMPYEKWGDWPEPEFCLVVDGAVEWSLQMKEEKPTPPEAVDNKGRKWNYDAPKVPESTAWNSHAKPPGGDCICLLHLKPKQIIQIRLKLLHSGENCLALSLVPQEQTPGVLKLPPAQRSCKGNIKLQKSYKKKTMEPEFTIDYRCEGADAFVIPKSYDGLQAELK